MTLSKRVLSTTSAMIATAGAALAIPVTFTDPIDGFGEFGGTWFPINESKPGYFSDMDQDGGPLVPLRGDRMYISRFNGDTFVGISRVFPLTLEPNITVYSAYDVGALTGDLFGFPDGSPQFFVFADINANNKYDPGEQIPSTSQDRPTPLAGEFEEWIDQTYIGMDTMTTGGDPAVGSKLGFVFQAKQPPSMGPDDIYAWAVDDLFLRVTRTVLDRFDNDDSWERIGSDGFWANADFPNDGLDPILGEQSFNARFTGNFVTLYKIFDGEYFEPGTTVSAEYFVGDPVDSTFGLLVPGSSQDQFSFTLFADTNGNGAFDPSNGETIVSRPTPFFPDQFRPIPDDEWQMWRERYIIQSDTTTFGGESVIGQPLGWVFRARMAASTNPPIYGFALDALRLDINDIEEPESIVLAAWDAVENRDDSGNDADNGDRTFDDTPDIIAPGISAILGGPGGAGSLQGGYEVRGSNKSTDLTFGNLPSPAAQDLPNASLLRTSNDSQRRLDFDITNTSTFPLRLDRVHFDYARLFNAGPKLLSLFMRTGGGDLDLTGFPLIFTTENTFVMGVFTGDYEDVDADVSVLEDNILAPGETAAFRFQVDNADQTFSNLAIDNIAITGVFSDCEADLAEPFFTGDYLDALEYLQSAQDNDDAAGSLAPPFDAVDGSDVNAYIQQLNSCPE